MVAGGPCLLGDPKVVAALAVAIVAATPVVNAIVAKALDQADTDWLKDIDFNAPPPENLPDQPPPDLDGDGEGRPPPGQRPQQRPCTPEARPAATRTLPPPINVDQDQGSVEITTQPGDLAVGFRIEAQSVTGDPGFALLEGSNTQWENQRRFHTNEDLREPNSDQPYRATPGVRWTLTWDLSSGVAHQGMSFALAAIHCREGP